MSHYVDGFITPIPNENKEAFREHSQKIAAMFKDLGALSWVQCWGDEFPPQKEVSFQKAVACREDETVCFAYIVWPSREFRNQAMQAFAKTASEMDFPKLFDHSRMIIGGFEEFVADGVWWDQAKS